jgi:hypothetical protein
MNKTEKPELVWFRQEIQEVDCLGVSPSNQIRGRFVGHPLSIQSVVVTSIKESDNCTISNTNRGINIGFNIHIAGRNANSRIRGGVAISSSSSLNIGASVGDFTIETKRKNGCLSHY